MDKVPVIWGYNFDEVIGNATIDEAGVATFQITDPRIIDLVRKNDRTIKVISLYHEPAIRKET